MFKIPLEPLRKAVLSEHLPTTLAHQIMNTQTNTQINQFLPVFFCSISLIFFKLFCNSSLPLSVQQVCSASTFFYHSSLLQLALLFCSDFYLTLHICSISYCTYSPFFSFLQFHTFPSRTAHLTQSVSSSFMHTFPTIPLRVPLAETRTPILATETLTDSSS
jgi:hypothetical protein